MQHVDVSIIVPTYKEAKNLKPLTERIASAFQRLSISYEIVIVDDNSCDGTSEVVQEIQAKYPIRLKVRTVVSATC
jgi:dolichol-phosphate mannosyltransferase